MEDMTDWLIRRENSIGQEETANELKHKYKKALDDLVKYEKERQEDKERIKQYEMLEANINKANKIIKDGIPKSLVREKIQELKNKCNMIYGLEKCVYKGTIEILEELLNNKTS